MGPGLDIRQFYRIATGNSDQYAAQKNYFSNGKQLEFFNSIAKPKIKTLKCRGSGGNGGFLGL